MFVFVVGLEVSKSLLKFKKLILFRNVTNPHMNIVLMQTKPHDARVNVNRSNMKLPSIKKLIRSESNLLITSETFNMYSRTTHIPNSVLDF